MEPRCSKAQHACIHKVTCSLCPPFAAAPSSSRQFSRVGSRVLACKYSARREIRSLGKAKIKLLLDTAVYQNIWMGCICNRIRSVSERIQKKAPANWTLLCLTVYEPSVGRQQLLAAFVQRTDPHLLPDSRNIKIGHLFCRTPLLGAPPKMLSLVRHGKRKDVRLCQLGMTNTHDTIEL